MSQLYGKTPSEILCVEDEYTSYCLNEACAFIIRKIQNGESPSFVKHYSSFKELYSQYK